MGLGLLVVHLLLLLLLLLWWWWWWMLLLLGMEGGGILGLVAGGGARDGLAYQWRQRNGLAVLGREWQVLRVRRVGVIWLSVGLRVGLVLGVQMRARHTARIKGWGLHPSVQGWEGVTHGLLG